MRGLTQIVFGALVFAGLCLAGAIEATDKSLDGLLNKGVPTVLDLYATWCGHCKRLAPVYDELAEMFAHAQDKVQIVKIDADTHRKASKKFNVEYFPTLKFIDADGKQEDIEKRDLDDLVSLVESKTGIKAKRPRTEPSKVVDLTDTDFDKKVGQGEAALVAFTASWCGHCKRLKPEYEELARVYSRDPIVIGQVDATGGGADGLTEKYGISAFPTILYFPADGSDPVPYPSGRSLGAFVEWINEEAKLHRTPEGALDENAGIIPSLNELAAKAGSTNVVDKIKSSASKLDKDLQDYGQVYLRVAQKVADNGIEYVSKEIKRLEGILSKAAVSPEKLDQMKVRLNILNRFKPSSKEKEEL